MWIERHISDTLCSAARAFPALVLVGPRQVGKTALLEHVFPDLHRVSLDVPVVAEMAETMPERFLEKHPPPVIIDEVQYAPGLFRHLKAVIDQAPSARGRFLLTGSQNFALMAKVSDSLAGRTAVLPLLGLSGGEWSAVEELRARWTRWELLWRGSYPGLWAELDDAPPRDLWYQGYLATYLERDVRNLLRVGSLRDFDRFLRACAIRTGQTLNMADLARDVGIATSTAREWLSVLMASNQIFLLEPYHRSLGKRLVKSPKLYLCDTGLAAYLAGLQSAAGLRDGPMAGALWETWVVGQWVRWRDWLHPSAGLWYWRDQAGAEVDLVIEWDQRLYAIECKLTEQPGKSDLRGIKALRKMYGEEHVPQAWIACPCREGYEISPTVEARSGWTAWEV